MTMPNFIERINLSIGNNWNSPALTGASGVTISYGDLFFLVIHYHQYWESLGLQKGDKIAICVKNCIEWAVLYFAIVAGGFVASLIPVNIPLERLEEMIIHSDSKVLYIGESLYKQINLKSSPIPKFIVPIGIESEEMCSSSHNPSNYRDLQLCDEVIAKNRHWEVNNFKTVCSIMYTSGSSGAIKGVMLSVNNISFMIDQIIERIFPDVVKNECHICCLPFYHIYGLVCSCLAPLCLGEHVIIPSPKQDLKTIGRIFQLFRPKVVFTVPYMINSIVDYLMPEEGLSNSGGIIDFLGGRLEQIVFGGASLGSETEYLCLQTLNLPIVTGYGMTECGPVSSGRIDKANSHFCGKIINKARFKIHFSSNNSKFGEILIKGDNIFLGYYKNAEATKTAFTEDGWFKTGDLGYIDGDDNLFITGRCKDVLLTSNGQNVYPEEIESVLNGLPYISESILLLRGEKFHAIIVLDKDKLARDKLHDETLAKIIDANIIEASKYLPGFSIISTFEISEKPLERTSKGSIKRFLYS